VAGTPDPWRAAAGTAARNLRTRLRRVTRTRRVFGVAAMAVRFDGSVYYVPNFAAHRPVAQKILNKRYVEPALHYLVQEVMARRPGSMISAGTFFGDMLPSFSGKTPELVYAFEPVLENYLLAREVVAANDLDNVVLLHAGLGAKPGPGLARIGTSRVGQRHLGGASRIISRSQESQFRSQRVPMLSIDQLAVDDLSIIQLDVEGHELPVLKGAIGTIRSHQPVIVVEDNNRSCPRFLAELKYVEVAQLGLDHVYLPAAVAADAGDLIRPAPATRATSLFR
jgi:FkbM family methyltransferase